MIKFPSKEASSSDLARKKQEEAGDEHKDSSSNYHEKAKALIASSSMEPKWVRLQDPRIVRVARAYGGKDRHSKVCTIKGLRDRRVRLSVPTAIQLYDLQERLGFNQPSKVIDWLLNAAKNDIDELPPLPPLNLALLHHHHHHHHSILTSHNNSQTNDQEKEVDHIFWKLRKPREASSSHDDHDVKQQVSNNDDDDDGGDDDLSHPRHHPLDQHDPNPSINVGYQWEGNSVSHESLNNNNVVPFSSTLSLSTSTGNSSHDHHFPALFGGNMEMDNPITRQVNYSNQQYPMMMLSSSGSNVYAMSMAQSLKPFGLSMMTPNNTTTTDQTQSHNHLQNFPTK